MSEQENAVVNAEPITSEAFRKALNEAVRVDVSGGRTILYHGYVPAHTEMTGYDGLPPGAYIARFNVDGVEFHPVQVEPETYQPSNAFPTPESLREFVDERVHAALHGDEHSIVDAGQHRRVEMHEQDGSVWRGVLYRVQDHDNG